MADRFRGQDPDHQHGGLDEDAVEDEFAVEEEYGDQSDMSLHDEEAMQQEQGGLPPGADGDYPASADVSFDVAEEDPEGSP
ncbi:hypothetical protein [Actinomadura citrea]|jgi:hypothetical protein|uniref:DUF5709 domain-containing protein n=1 Tax=Actinomadura citrea TaxID=46158 RepID=A0A7Y9G508_9ACTN|nr:hypothetical protein [Actinomadura citrea]NYE10022.1 hypothetical protein [Actinomadura citrea]GGT69421.1 hypothetical protein GCM10010177_28570 [Actinomadura citrea]